MAEYARPANAQALQHNFAQIKPLMNPTMAHYESARCLYCYDAPCVQACPTGIDIPLFIRQINTGNVDGAASTIYAANYFGNACGKVCPTEVLCEGACVYNHQDVKPIEIGRLQSFATRQAMRKQLPLATPSSSNGQRVAVIGAGPAGISCACELTQLGYEVHLFEARAQASGLALYGCAPYKVTNEELLEEVAYLQAQFGFSIAYNHPINDRADLLKLEQNYDAIFLGIGLGKTSSMGIPGENLVNSWGATELIETIKIDPLNVAIGQRVLVIGGGNTAMDAASESARMGAAAVTLAYRRSKEEMRAYGFEYDLAKAVGVKGLFNVSPIAILGEERVEAVRLAKTQVVDGLLVKVPDSEFDWPCDMVIRATGQSKKVAFLEQIEGLQLDSRDRIIVDPLTHQCTNPQYFAAGDAINGGAEVVNACAEAKLAAKGIHQYLQNEKA
ncbi:MAG: FAD-dependent oxidoreductase [Bacteroidota bacterium]